MVRALPGFPLEAAGRVGHREERAGSLGLQPLQRRAEPVAQGPEPGRRFRLEPLDDRRIDAHAGSLWRAGNEAVWRRAMPRIMAAATATLSERRPGRIRTTNPTSPAPG